MSVGALLFAGTLAFTACAGGAAPVADSAAPSASVEPRSTVLPRATPTPAPSAPAVGGEAVAERDQEPFADDAVLAARCQDSQFELAVSPLPDESGAGHFGFSLVFTNVSPADCFFDGWPGLIAIDADGNEVGWPASADSSSASLVVVAANGGVATAHVRAAQAGAYGCEQIDAWGLRARIGADGAGGDGIDAPYAITVCGGDTSTMTISPLVAG